MKYILDASVALKWVLPEAYALASAARISLYDCLYVALAEREGCRLVTGDIRLINVLQKDHPLIVALDSV